MQTRSRGYDATFAPALPIAPETAWTNGGSALVMFCTAFNDFVSNIKLRSKRHADAITTESLLRVLYVGGWQQECNPPLPPESTLELRLQVWTFTCVLINDDILLQERRGEKGLVHTINDDVHVEMWELFMISKFKLIWRSNFLSGREATLLNIFTPKIVLLSLLLPICAVCDEYPLPSNYRFQGQCLVGSCGTLEKKS